MIEYWDKRLELFGPEKAFLPLTLDGVLSDDEVALGVGFVRILPITVDPGGRKSIMAEPGRQDLSKYTRESMVRAVWYIMHTILESTDDDDETT